MVKELLLLFLRLSGATYHSLSKSILHSILNILRKKQKYWPISQHVIEGAIMVQLDTGFREKILHAPRIVQHCSVIVV
jgi:hypothetical protein